jgi:conjugal transfer pilus assembly protein TraK
MIKKCFLLLLFLPLICFGLQTKSVLSNETVAAEVSTTELTRIFVANDRIKSIRGVDGSYIYKNDDAKGEIYLKPTEAFQKKIFNIFITTENGNTFTLMLIPKDIPAQTIMIKTKNVNFKAAGKWETSASYQNTLLNLINAMINNANPEGYAVSEVLLGKKILLGNIAELKLIKTYTGMHLRGEIYQLNNRADKAINITEKEFYRANTRAVAISSSVVQKNSSALVYVVIDND